MGSPRREAEESPSPRRREHCSRLTPAPPTEFICFLTERGPLSQLRTWEPCGRAVLRGEWVVGLRGALHAVGSSPPSACRSVTVSPRFPWGCFGLRQKRRWAVIIVRRTRGSSASGLIRAVGESGSVCSPAVLRRVCDTPVHARCGPPSWRPAAGGGRCVRCLSRRGRRVRGEAEHTCPRSCLLRARSCLAELSTDGRKHQRWVRCGVTAF